MVAQRRPPVHSGAPRQGKLLPEGGEAAVDRSEMLNQLKFLYDQVYQTSERLQHLPERMPMQVEAQSLNYDDDLLRLQGEYNRAVKRAQEEGLLTAADLEAEGLPLQFERRKQPE